MNISIGDIGSIAATYEGLRRVSARRSLTARRDHRDVPRPLPGSEEAKSPPMQPLDSCRTPSCEYAKPRKPARKNTGHEMCDLARDMNRAMRVVETTDFLDDLGNRVIRKINCPEGKAMNLTDPKQDERIRAALRNADKKGRLQVVAAVTGIAGGVAELRRIMNSAEELAVMDRGMLAIHLN